MKNNKYVTYVLLAVVVLIWGLIGWRLFSGFSSYPVPVTIATDYKEYKKLEVRQDSFEVAANYRDPFLGRLTVMHATEQQEIKKTSEPKKNVLWPNIKYGGIITRQKSGNSLALITINNKDYLFFENEEKEEIKLIYLKSDSVRVQFQGELKTLKKDG